MITRTDKYPKHPTVFVTHSFVCTTRLTQTMTVYSPLIFITLCSFLVRVTTVTCVISIFQVGEFMRHDIEVSETAKSCTTEKQSKHAHIHRSRAVRNGRWIYDHLFEFTFRKPSIRKCNIIRPVRKKGMYHLEYIQRKRERKKPRCSIYIRSRVRCFPIRASIQCIQCKRERKNPRWRIHNRSRVYCIPIRGLI